MTKAEWSLEQPQLKMPQASTDLTQSAESRVVADVVVAWLCETRFHYAALAVQEHTCKRSDCLFLLSAGVVFNMVYLLTSFQTLDIVRFDV